MTEEPTSETEPIARQLIVQQEMILDTLNGLYEDATLFVGRILGERRGATRARALRVTIDGIELLVTDDDGDHATTVPFESPPTDVDELFLHFFVLVIQARELSGEGGTTSVETIIATASGYRTFLTEVLAVHDISPHLRQITFGGGDLADLTPVGPDTFLYLLLPPMGHTELSIDRTFSWERVRDMPAELQPVGAYYTVRRWRPERAELDIHVVLHGDSGPASAWAAHAVVGDPVALWGPRTAWAPPDGADQYVLVADETGLPAVAVILETLGPDTPIQVVAEVASEADRQLLPEADHIQVTWLHRDDREAGTTTLLVDAVRALTAPEGEPYVWGGAESRAMTAVRRHVRDIWGLDQSHVSLVGYWRHRAHQDDPDD